MAKFHFTNKAVDDLTAIWHYTVKVWSERQADKYYEMLISTCRLLANNPIALGRRYKDIGDNLLGFKAGKHILFYQIETNNDILIIRILHEHMDLKNQLQE